MLLQRINRWLKNTRRENNGEISTNAFLERSVRDNAQHSTGTFNVTHHPTSQLFQSLIPIATCSPHSTRPPTVGCRESEHSGITRGSNSECSFPKDEWAKIPPHWEKGHWERLSASYHKLQLLLLSVAQPVTRPGRQTQLPLLAGSKTHVRRSKLKTRVCTFLFPH